MLWTAALSGLRIGLQIGSLSEFANFQNLISKTALLEFSKKTAKSGLIFSRQKHLAAQSDPVRISLAI